MPGPVALSAAIATFDRLWGCRPSVRGDGAIRLALLQQRAAAPESRRSAATGARSIERSLGPEHPWFARCLVTLANLRNDAGDMQEAEAINRRALAFLDRIHQTGTMLDATLPEQPGRPATPAERLRLRRALFRRSLAIAEGLQARNVFRVDGVAEPGHHRT